MNSRLVTLCFVLLGTMLISACGSGPPARLYLLEPILDPEATQAVDDVSDIGVAMISLPSYASDQKIASRDTAQLITQADRHRWAEEPEEAITRVFADRLRYVSKANVVIEPWPRGYEPQARVEVDFDKLLRENSGGVEMSGQIRIIAGDGRSVKAIRTFQVIHYAESTDFSAYFSAVSAGINDVVRIAISAMQANAE